MTDVHTWFSLSYANYLVVPRSVMQSMPEDWQHRFTALMDEMHESFGHLEWPPYDVRALKREPEHIESEDCVVCDGEGVTMGENGFVPCGECDGGLVDVDRWETPEEVGIRPDPIPHYNRGRTRLEPR